MAQGIGRLLKAGAAPPDIAPVLEPYFAIVAPYVASENPRYPGSPALAAALLRKQDRMIFCEAHPDVANALKPISAATNARKSSRSTASSG